MAEQPDFAIGSEGLRALLDTETRPILAEFWAPWCGTCKLLAGSVRRLGTERSNDVRVATVNVEDDPDAAEQFSVRTLPTTLIFQNGREARRITGLISYTKLETEIAALGAASNN